MSTIMTMRIDTEKEGKAYSFTKREPKTPSLLKKTRTIAGKNSLGIYQTTKTKKED